MHLHALHSPRQGRGYGTFGQYSRKEWYWEHFQHWYLLTVGFFLLILFRNLCLMTSLLCLAVHWDEMCPGWLHHLHGHSLDVHSYSSGTFSLKPHLPRRRVNLDLPIPFVSLPDSSLSDGPGSHISGSVLDRWVCLYLNPGIGVEHPLSWGVHMV